jgi:hypothetical protein
MAKTWQYPILAELPPADKLTGDWDERTDPGKWAPKLPDIYFQAHYLSKAISSNLGAAPPAELIMIDKWGPILPARRYEKAYLTAAIMPQGAHLEKPWYDGHAALTFIMEKTRTHF